MDNEHAIHMKFPLKVAPIRPEILAIETQQIMQVSSLAMDDPEVIALWYGESDVSTPKFICVSIRVTKGNIMYASGRLNHHLLIS